MLADQFVSVCEPLKVQTLVFLLSMKSCRELKAGGHLNQTAQLFFMKSRKQEFKLLLYALHKLP